MNKLGTELANAWMKKTLVDLNGFSENEIPKNRDEAYKALNLFYEELDKKTVGWKIGAVAKEVQKEEGFDGPVPGKIFKETILPSNCSIKYSEIPYSNLECEYAFEIDQDVKIDGELLNKINNFKLHTAIDITASRYVQSSKNKFKALYASSRFFGISFSLNPFRSTKVFFIHAFANSVTNLFIIKIIFN